MVAQRTLHPAWRPLAAILLSSLPLISQPAGASDLTVTLDGPFDPVEVGHDLTYTAVASNDGGEDARGVVLEDTLPPGTFVVALSPQPECAATGRLVRCTFGDLAAGDSRTATITVRPLRCGWLTNLAEVSGRSPEANSSNNLAAINTTVESCLLVARTQVDGSLQVRGGDGTGVLTSSQQVGTQPPQLKNTQARARTLDGQGIVLQALTDAAHTQASDLKAAGDYQSAALVTGSDPPGTPVDGLELAISLDGSLRTFKGSDFGSQEFATRFVLEVRAEGITDPLLDEYFVCGATLSPDQSLSINPGTGATVKCRPGDLHTSTSTTVQPNDTREATISKQGTDAFRLPLAPVAVGDTFRLTIFLACGSIVPAGAGEGTCDFYNTFEIAARAQQPGTGLVFSPADAGDCTTAGEQLCLAEGRYRFAVTWQDDGGASGTGTATQLAGDTGFFSFARPGEPDLVLRMAPSGRHGGELRIYQADLAAAGYTVTVTDTLTRLTRTFTHPGQRDSRDPAASLARSQLESQETQPLPGTMATCTAGPGHLCLGGQRFRLEVSWRDAQGATGVGLGTARSSDTATFSFADPGQIELAVRVLADGQTGGFEVRSGALSATAYTLTVTDTTTGTSRVYIHPLRGSGSGTALVPAGGSP